VRLAKVVIACALLGGTPGALHGEVTKALEAELPVAPGRAFAVENLAGAMKVTPAPGPVVRVRAEVHAESEELAAGLAFVTVPGKDGAPTLRLQYPLDRVRELRYPARGPGRDTGIEYQDRRVEVSGTRGTLVYADLVVEVPIGAGPGRLATRVGAIEAERLDGELRLDTGSGSIRLVHSRGRLTADTGSGDVRAADVQGTFRCDTGSGACDVQDFEGETLECDTGSGEVVVLRAQARAVKADTGSGRVRLEAVDAEEVAADTGSGPVEMALLGARLRAVKADTGSGTVRLRLPAEAGFTARASLGSGRLRCEYPDAKTTVKHAEVVGCRRGDGRIAVSVDTGSGGLVIEPAR
jgi:hypothetical protein